MIKRIISGGQTGAGQAGLEVALRFDIPYGGWIPKGRKTEKGPLPEKYLLNEADATSYAKCAEMNIAMSDGTVIISHGRLSGIPSLTRKTAIERGHPWVHIDLNNVNVFEAAKTISSWISQHRIEVLHIAGSSSGRDPAIYQATLKLFQAVFYMDVIETNLPAPGRANPLHPQTVKEAVERLTAEMPLKDRTLLSRMDEVELASLQPTLGKYIRDKYGLGSGNENLVRSCRYLSGKYELSEEAAAALILKNLWEALRKTHLMRIVK